MKRRAPGLSTLLAIWIALFVPALSGAEPVPSVSGQWIWSAQDKALFAEARRTFPALLPGVWVGTLSYQAQGIRLRRALSPVLEIQGPVAAVLRFDESLHASWDRLSVPELAAGIDAQVGELLARIQGAGAELGEVQLDYDCPVRRLAQWAEVVRYLGAHSLRGRTVWITSLVAHLQSPEFGNLFRDAVAGHILQLFDTGASPAKLEPESLADLLARQGLPFCLGLGSFERALATGSFTDHRAWFAAVPVFASNSEYRGLWIFPAGRAWLAFLPESEKKP